MEEESNWRSIHFLLPSLLTQSCLISFIIFYLVFFLPVVISIQRYINHELNLKAKELSKLVYNLREPKLKYWLIQCQVILSFIVYVLSWPCELATSPNIATIREKKLLPCMSLVLLVSSIIFLYRSTTNGDAGTAKVISIAALVIVITCFITPNFSVEGSKRILDFNILVKTCLACWFSLLGHLFISALYWLVFSHSSSPFLRPIFFIHHFLVNTILLVCY